MHLYLDHLRSFSREARLFLVALTIFAFATSVPALFFYLYLQALGFDRTFIGLTATASQLGGVIFSIPAAGLLDLLGRRHAMLIGAASSILCAAVSLLITDATLLIVAQVVSGCGTVLYALAVVPLLAEVSTPYERTALFSTTESLTTLALFFGSLLAGALPTLVAPLIEAGPESALTYRVVMLGSLALRMTGLLPLALIHDHATTQPASAPHRSTLSYFDPRVLLRLQTPIWVMALPILTCYLAGSLIFPFLNIYLKQRFNASDVSIGAVLGLINLCIGICTLLGPLAAQKFGRVRVAIYGTLLSAACLLLVTLSAGRAIQHDTAALSRLRDRPYPAARIYDREPDLRNVGQRRPHYRSAGQRLCAGSRRVWPAVRRSHSALWDSGRAILLGGQAKVGQPGRGEHRSN
jgi:MFS family permease